MSKQQLTAMAAAVAPSATTTVPAALANFSQLPDDGFVREPIVCGLFAVSHATVWRMVQSGRLPKPVKITPKITAWRVGELRATLAALGGAA
jgi:predicted DNA-binding transcriptional regulator AlpA